VLALGLFACDGAEPDGPLDVEAPSWGDDDKDDALGNALLPTTEFDVMPLDGWDRALDLRRGACVRPIDDSSRFSPFQITGARQTTTLQYLSSREQLENSLNLSIGTKAKVAGVGVEASLGIANSFKETGTSTFLLLEGRAGYIVLDQRPRELTEEAAELLETDIDAFHGRCGTHFVQGIGYEAAVDLLIEIDTETVEQTDEVRAALSATGVAAGGGAVTLDPTIESTLKQASALDGVATNVTVRTEGFFAGDADVAKLTNRELTAESFTVLSKLLTGMAETAQVDMCRDGGEGSCGGSTAPGYLANPIRGATARRIFAGDYRDLPNAPRVASGFNPYLDLAGRDAHVEGHLQKLVRLRDRIAWLHAHDLKPLVESDEPWRWYLYREANVTLDNMTLDLLTENSKVWESRFDPNGGDAYEMVQDEIDRCIDDATQLDFAACLRDPENTDAYATWAHHVDRYLAESRPVELHYRPVPVGGWNEETQPEWLNWVETYCYDVIGDDDQRWRLPDAVEVTRLALVLANGLRHETDHVEGFDGHVIWFYDEDTCPDFDAGFMAYDDETGATKMWCIDNPRVALTGICVPESGLYGDLPEPPAL
jgi:hypothetical protein